MYGPGDVRVEEREGPRIVEPTDAIIRVSAACVCGSDLWPYRGIGVEESWSSPMGHEYAGIVEEVGAEVQTVKPGQFVVGWSGPPTTPARSAGPATRAPASTASPWARRAPKPTCCASRSPTAPSGHPRPPLRRPRPEPPVGLRRPRHRLVRRRRRRSRPGKTVAVVGDGAVGCAVLAAEQLGADRMIAMSRHESRQPWRASTRRPTSSRSVVTPA